MPSVIVHATERSVFEVNLPPAQRIDAAFASVQMGGGNWGAWVGPRPRITRRAIIGQGFATDVAQLYAWPDNDFTAAHITYMRTELRDGLAAALHQQSADWHVTLEAYSPEANGAIDWWSTGQASITHTRDAVATLAGRIDADENPTGPTTDATHPTSVAQLAQRANSALRQTATSVLLPLLGIASIAAIVWLVPRRTAPAPAQLPPEASRSGVLAHRSSIARRSTVSAPLRTQEGIRRNAAA